MNFSVFFPCLSSSSIRDVSTKCHSRNGSSLAEWKLQLLCKTRSLLISNLQTRMPFSHIVYSVMAQQRNTETQSSSTNAFFFHHCAQEDQWGFMSSGTAVQLWTSQLASLILCIHGWGGRNKMCASGMDETLMAHKVACWLARTPAHNMLSALNSVPLEITVVFCCLRLVVIVEHVA